MKINYMRVLLHASFNTYYHAPQKKRLRYLTNVIIVLDIFQHDEGWKTVEKILYFYKLNFFLKVVKVADFGVARFQNQEGVMTAETGTYRWMAPEV